MKTILLFAAAITLSLLALLLIFLLPLAAATMPTTPRASSSPAQTQSATSATNGNSVHERRVRPVVLKSLMVMPVIVAGSCQTAASGEIRLTGRASIEGASVSLSSTNPAARIPAVVVIPAGATSAKFPIKTSAVTNSQNGIMTATFGTAKLSRPFKVRPAGIKSLAFAAESLAGGSSAQGIVTLECRASPDGVVVKLSSSNPVIGKPETNSVTIPAGETSATFTVRTKSVPTTNHAYIRATTAGASKNVKLTINPG